MVQLLFVMASLLVAGCVATPQIHIDLDETLKYEPVTSLDRAWEDFKTTHGSMNFDT
jgi:hypothetical protein